MDNTPLCFFRSASSLSTIFGRKTTHTHTHARTHMFFIIHIFLVDGSLNELLYDPDTGEPSGLPSNQSLFYLQQILYAVHFLHQRAILHLDLKCKSQSVQ